ncbi:hypothetical protein NDU88_002351 [Pleurodeles waltl]|uniref:Uncharacterized protein n=1 Tax=Pleurodeles waltl TaxID=8319 RepID=A0AAV7L110_PLEWA|nr:hypothetical protein NDU88_002351 [Pleurodeles waltl]
MPELSYVQHGQTRETCWEKPRKKLEGEKPARGKRGERHASWRSVATRIEVQPCRRRRKMQSRRRRRKEDAAQSR